MRDEATALRRRRLSLRPRRSATAGQISREIFVNDEIYPEELERVFARAWLFVGHESQIPNPGDFFVSSMGEESVILCRDRAGKVHVFLNSCRHRGMKVCRYDEGNTAVFTCPYHGWSYRPTAGWSASPISARPTTAAGPLAMGPRRGRAVVQLQGHGLGHLGPRGAALSRISRRFRPLSRPDPRRLGRQRGRRPRSWAASRNGGCRATGNSRPRISPATAITTSATARSIWSASAPPAAAAATCPSVTRPQAACRIPERGHQTIRLCAAARTGRRRPPTSNRRSSPNISAIARRSGAGSAASGAG